MSSRAESVLNQFIARARSLFAEEKDVERRSVRALHPGDSL